MARALAEAGGTVRADPRAAPLPPSQPRRSVLYHGWMYAAAGMPAGQAEALQPGQSATLAGFLWASAQPGADLAGAAVVLAMYGTALDVSAMNGQPPGTTLLVRPGETFAVSALARTASGGAWVTLVQTSS